MNYPQRIVCLTEETTETLYAIGAEDRIVGISGFTVRPERARKEKPKVSAFTSAKTDAYAHELAAVANNHLYEIKSPLILQPGPAALTAGLDALCEIIDRSPLISAVEPLDARRG